jgi:RNA polymerase-binding transcription factor DksA
MQSANHHHPQWPLVPTRRSEETMTRHELEKFRTRLRTMARRIQGTAESAEDQARQPTGGEAAGDLSNVPIHLGDVGSEVLAQELGATLLENEQYLQGEILGALDRIDKGTYGRCENCGRGIAHERLQALPYARHCVACAAALHAGREVNLNEGRPKNWTEGIGLRAEGPPPWAPGGPQESTAGGDPHAAGTPGGGTAVGGLAGTNVGIGEPEGHDLEGAMGSSTFDVAIETEQIVEQPKPEEEPAGGYSGHAGGAVGGTPANKRASGGHAQPRKPR